MTVAKELEDLVVVAVVVFGVRVVVVVAECLRWVLASLCRSSRTSARQRCSFWSNSCRPRSNDATTHHTDRQTTFTNIQTSITTRCQM